MLIWKFLWYQPSFLLSCEVSEDDFSSELLDTPSSAFSEQWLTSSTSIKSSLELLWWSSDLSSWCTCSTETLNTNYTVIFWQWLSMFIVDSILHKLKCFAFLETLTSIRKFGTWLSHKMHFKQSTSTCKLLHNTKLFFSKNSIVIQNMASLRVNYLQVFTGSMGSSWLPVVNNLK